MQACFLVFDVLAIEGEDLRGQPYAQRRDRLVELLAAARPPLAVVPATGDPVAAAAWMHEHAAAGIEGVVAKHADHGYRPRHRQWRKIRTRHTTEAVVGGVLGPVDAPTGLILGRPDPTGRLRIVGRAGPLPAHARAELTPVLTPLHLPAGERHPWPAVIPSSRFGQLPAQPVVYTQVRPALVVELDADTARDRHRWRHVTRYLRCRLDLHPGDLDPGLP